MASRIKERGGGSGKVIAPKPQKIQTETITPRLQPITRKTLTATATKIATKERVTASSLRNQAEIPTVRWSTSSIPRGKSSNNLDLSLKDKLGKASNLKNGLSRRSSMDVKDRKSLGKFRSSDDLATKSVLEKQKNKENLVANYKVSSEKLKVKENVNAASNVAVFKSCNNPSVNNESHKVHAAKIQDHAAKMGKRSGEDETFSENFPLTAELASKSELEVLGNMEKFGAISKIVDTKPDTSVPVSNETIKEKASKLELKVEERSSGSNKVFEDNCETSDQAAKKYPTKLHEKLAALEGRVQRIASDIKKTKDLLALNEDQSHSKLILSDIQKKISGIENAVSFVIEEDGAAFGLSDIVKDNNLPISSGNARNVTCSSKGLNLDELEARFYPHQKFMKNRSSLICNSNGSRSPTDENPIALEFLNSLNIHGAKAKEMVVEKGSSGVNIGSRIVSSLQNKEDTSLMASEKLEDFDDQENKQTVTIFEETEDSVVNQIFEIGRKPSTGGWFVSEGEAVLLTHNDGTCSYYDIANYEEKAEYKPPGIASSNLWGDCWLIRAPGSDGCSGKYVVAASAGNTLESGFCSWDFYTKRIKAFKFEPETPSSSSIPTSRVALAPLSNIASSFRRNTSCTVPSATNQQWWYRPCGPLLIYTASGQKNVSAYDIRDGENLMKWNTNGYVAEMEYSSPLQWRSRGKIVLAENEAVCVWDVNSLTPQPLLSIMLSGKKISCLHVNNTDAEVGGGVRQRARSSEVEGNDGVFCTQDSINVLDFRLSSGVGLRISKQSSNNAHSVFSSGDSIFIGSTETRLPSRSGSCSRVQHFSIRSGKQMSTYPLPDSNSHLHHSSITQVWGNSNFVMGISGMGLSIFYTGNDATNIAEARETVGPDDLYCPTFDYLGSRVLVISRDRPAMWRYLL